MNDRIAVLAVHGIADQGPGESSRLVANLLRRGGQIVTEQWMHFPLDQPLPIQSPSLGSDPDLAGSLGIAPGETAFPEASVEAHRALVAEIRGSDGPEIDVHEAWWADLSSPPIGFLGLFRELWVVLLHFPRLGERVYNEIPRKLLSARALWLLDLQRALRTMAYALLTVAIASTNVVLLGMVAMLVASLGVVHGTPDRLIPVVLHLVLDAAAALLVMGLIALFLLFRGIPIRPDGVDRFGGPGARLGLALAPPLSGIAAGIFVQREVAWDGSSWLLAIDAVTALWILAWFAANHVQLRARARPWWFGGIGLLGCAVLGIEVARHRADPVLGPLHGVEWVFGALTLEWVLFYTLLSVSVLAAGGLWLMSRRLDADLARVVRGSLWGSLVSLHVPAVGYSVITLAAWSAFVMAISAVNLIPPELAFRGIGAEHSFRLFEILQSPAAEARSLPAFAAQMGGRMGALSLVAGGAYLGCLVLPAVWAVLPSAVLEFRPKVRLGSAEDDSVRLGVWVSEWGRATWYGVLALFAAIPAALVLLPFIAAWWDDRWTIPVMLSGTALIAAIQVLLRPVRSVFDLLLDIDSYFRDSPAHSTPRRRMFERFLAILDRLSGYRAVVIVAHSQGAIIAADLLRLRRILALVPGLPEIHLVTMGPPLRQLYQVVLPRAYDWLDATDPCVELGVKSWTNLYTTGDYVGRQLWTTSPSRWLPGQRWSGPGQRSELCLGAGGHVHYWDGTFPEVGGEVRRLIDRLGTRSVGIPSVVPRAVASAD
jgi:hypothetical protein